MATTPEKQKGITVRPLLAVLTPVNPGGTAEATCFSHRVKDRNIIQNPNVV